MENSISFIIPAWNEEKVILATCKFLRKLKLPFKYSEIIFIAGGVDKTYDICKNIKLENFNHTFILKQNPRDFKSGALIKGIRKAKGKIITLLDADTLVVPNFMVEVARSLKKYDVVNCNYFPMIKKGFWYNYFIINKLNWSKNPDNLSSLFGASTISLNRAVIEEIGINNFFTKKSTAGVDYYMGIVLHRNKKIIGFVKNSHVITPRPASLKDFRKDQLRWFRAFFQIHHDNKRILFSTFFLSCLMLIPFITLLYNFKKIINITTNKKLKVKFYLILFFIEYFMNLIRLKAVIERFLGRVKNLGHFKGSRY